MVEWSEQLRLVTSVWLGTVRRRVQIRPCTSGCRVRRMFGIYLPAWFAPVIIIIVVVVVVVVNIIIYRELHAVYITIDGSHYMWQKAQTAISHYTREPADWPTLKLDTGMLTHLPLGDSGTRLQRHSLPRTSMFQRIISHQLGLSRPTPLMNASLRRAMHMSDDGRPQTSGAYHFDSSQPTHLRCPRINASQPPKSKPYFTNRSEE